MKRKSENLRIGSLVCLKDNPKAGTATILKRYGDIKGGVVLSVKLDGFYSWNIADLKRARKAIR